MSKKEYLLKTKKFEKVLIFKTRIKTTRPSLTIEICNTSDFEKYFQFRLIISKILTR